MRPLAVVFWTTALLLGVTGVAAGADTGLYLGSPVVPHPGDNLGAAGKIELGRTLFFEARFSSDGKVSFPELGTNGVACAQCHPNAADTHPETYPKFQRQLGKVAALRDMINWCLSNPREGEPLALDDARMIAIEAYVAYERRGVPMAPGQH